jgi:hypothetical protein
MDINEYYKYYLMLHQHPKCKLLHFLGQWTTILFTTYILYNWVWYMTPLIPFIIYPFAWTAHLFFEKNKPAAFSNPLYAKWSDWIMFKEILQGKHRIW